MSVLSTAQLEAAWIAAGGNPAKAPMAAAIAHAESGATPTAVCHNCVPGVVEHSIGLWQINIAPNANPQFSSWNLFNPVTNAKAAIKLSGNGTNWGDWTTYTNGAYKKFLTSGVAPSTSVPGAVPTQIKAAGPAVVKWFESLSPVHQLEASSLSLPAGSRITSSSFPKSSLLDNGLPATGLVTYINRAGKQFTMRFLAVAPGSTKPGNKNPLFGPTPGQTTGAVHKATSIVGAIAGFLGALTLERVGFALLAFVMVAAGLLLLVSGSITKALSKTLNTDAGGAPIADVAEAA